LSAILLLALGPNAARAWLRPTHEDATVVERSELIVAAHLKPGSIRKVPHDTPPGAGVSWEHHATLVITTVLKGQCDKKEVPVIVHYGLDPVERVGEKGGIEIIDTGSSARGGGSLVKDAGRDNLWFLRKRSGTFGREPGAGDFGVVDPEDVQPLDLKPYFLSYMDRDPEAAVKAFAGKNPAVAERSKRYLDHLEVQRALKIEDMGKRHDALLPFFLARATWNMKQEAAEALVACGATAGEGLKDVFTNPKHRNFRPQIIRMWRDMNYREVAPVLIALLKEHDRFWAAQDLKKGWWSDNSEPELTRQRQEIYGEAYAATYTLRAFRDPEAKDALELTRARWVAINFDNKQIVEECEAALRELPAKDTPVPPAADKRREAAIALKVALDGDKATVTVAFNYTGKAGDPPTFEGVRMYRYEMTADKGPTRVGWGGTEGKQTVVMGGKKYTYYPALTDRKENGTLSVTKVDGGKVRLAGVYHYDGVLFVIDETLESGAPVLLEAAAADGPKDGAAIAVHIKALSDTNSEKRAAAAQALRRIVARYPSGTIYLSTKDGGEAAWQEKVNRVEPGMAKTEVLKLLPPFVKGSENSGISEGDSHVVIYRLDYHWMVRIAYRNADKVIAPPELLKGALQVYVAPPKGFTGTWVTWHVNGQKAHEFQYKDGHYDGAVTSFHDNGRKSTVQHYANRNAHGPGAGWKADGTLSYTIQYRDGKQNGRWTHWHANGNKHSEADYADGKYHGRVTYWHENGQIGAINDYKEGVKHGREASWDQKGTLQYDRQFVNGEIVK
jgi:hypothetical protein